jgi:hypothetical protein
LYEDFTPVRIDFDSSNRAPSVEQSAQDAAASPGE